MGRFDMTAVAVGTSSLLLDGSGAPIAEEGMRRTLKMVRRAWMLCERRVPPRHLADHISAAPSLLASLPPHTLLDALPDRFPVPEPVCDDDGRRLHALVQRGALVRDVFSGRCAALVWATTPVIGMVHTSAGVVGLSTRRCGALHTEEEALCILERVAPNDASVECTVFEKRGYLR